ncbi:MAG TPA: MBL fold metallo-hydrolase [Bacteroidetes bacterium]|nr:MBL fold metallo-hydrolase [Bacteroidota bacterium]
MKVTFLGTGTSMGVPVAGGFGREVPTGDFRDDRMRSSIWVQTRQSSILVDVGPEFRLQSIRAGLRRIDLLLITHEHFDHIGGLDDLRPFNYMQKASIPVVTTPSCKESIERRYDYIFEPGKTPGSVDIDINTESTPFNFRDCRITPLPVMHGDLMVYGFRINDLAYINDTNFIPESTLELIKGCKVLILDALRWEPTHPTHFTVSESVEIARKTGIPEVYFIHMSSYVHHAETNKRLPDGMKLAFDQQVIYL